MRGAVLLVVGPDPVGAGGGPPSLFASLGLGGILGGFVTGCPLLAASEFVVATVGDGAATERRPGVVWARIKEEPQRKKRVEGTPSCIK